MNDGCSPPFIDHRSNEAEVAMNTDRISPNGRKAGKRAHVKGLMVVATLLGSLAITSGGATAGTQTEEPVACYEQVPYQEYTYSKTVSTPTTVTEYRWDIETRTEQFKDLIEKETRTRTWNAGVWQNFSPNNDQGPFEGPPSWPTDPRGTWQHQDKSIPGGHEGPDGVYQRGSGNGSWFYRAAGSWSAWGPWTDWPDAGPLPDDGRDRGPLPHASGDGWERQYRYVVVGQISVGYTSWVPAGSTPWGTSNTRPADTETTQYINAQTRQVAGAPTVTTVLYNDGAWTTETLGDPWMKIDERTSFRNGEQIPCDEKPDPTVERTSTSTCAPAGSTAATVTTTTTTTEYVLNDDFEWVLGTPVVKTSTSYRPLTEEEANDPDCAPAPEVTTTEWKDGTFACGDTTVTQTRTVTTTPYTWVPSDMEDDEEPQVEAVARIEAKPVFGSWELDTENAKSVTETRTRKLTSDEIVPCPTVPPLVPTTAVEAASQPPAAPQPPAAAPTTTQAPTAAAPAASLPSTGGSSLTMALVALVVLLGGTALVRLGRRPTD
jgi:hypothetical protein